jgi:hypothetical protein
MRDAAAGLNQPLRLPPHCLNLDMLRTLAQLAAFAMFDVDETLRRMLGAARALREFCAALANA